MKATICNPDLGSGARLAQVLHSAAEAAERLGWPQVAALMGHQAAGEPLVQVVCRGSLVETVQGLPAAPLVLSRGGVHFR